MVKLPGDVKELPAWAKTSFTRKELRSELAKAHKEFSDIWTALEYAAAHCPDARKMLDPARAQAKLLSQRLFRLAEHAAITVGKENK